MAIAYNYSIPTAGMLLCADAGNPRSYPGSGTSWYDISGNNNIGALTNAPTYNSGLSGSFSFNGSTQYAGYNSSLFNTTYTGKTVICIARMNPSAWTAGVGQYRAMFGSSGSNRNFNLYMYRDTSNIYYMHYSTGVGGSLAGTLSGSLNVSLNTWYMYAVTQATGGAVNYYLNGSVVTTTTMAFSQYLSSTSENIGLSDNYWYGDIAMCSVYSTELSSAQIAQVYNAYRGRYGI